MATKRSKPKYTQAQLRRLYHEKPLEVLVYWMNERELIRLRREQRMSPPWTRDPILHNFKFTNVFRKYDAVTQHYLKWVHDVRGCWELLILSTVFYRLVNWPPTLNETGVLKGWGAKERRRIERVFKSRAARKEQMYTGAYMLPSYVTGEEKYHSTLETMDWAAKRVFSPLLHEVPDTVEGLIDFLLPLPRIGGFMAYEIATDISYFQPLRDVDTYAHVGPGAIRGLKRLHGKELHLAHGWNDPMGMMVDLLQVLRRRWNKKFEPIGLREVEHSLCEFDKYCRVLLNQGRPRSKYIPEDPEINQFL